MLAGAARSGGFNAAHEQARLRNPAMNPPPSHDLRGLMLEQYDSPEHRRQDVALIERLSDAGRIELEEEAERLGITHGGRSDFDLRLLLLAWHRNGV